MVLKINGVDITPYIAYQGVKWQRADVDGPNAGMNMYGYTIRNRLRTRHRLDVTCRPLKLNEASLVLSLIKPTSVMVTYTDPEIGGEVTREMYSNNIPAQFLIRRKNGVELWGGITFPLVEM